MKNKQIILCAFLLLCPFLLYGQQSSSVASTSCANNQGYIQHPWQGKKVGYIGDSITDPNCYGNEIKKYWDFLKEWLGITPYVYGVSGRQWNDVPRQAEKLKEEHGTEVDAIIVLMGTNDFNNGVPIGEWFTEKEFGKRTGTRGRKRSAALKGLLECGVFKRKKEGRVYIYNLICADDLG